MAIEKTYNMIKPDGVRNGHIGEIISRIERVGLTIERMELGMVTLEEAEANYGEHKGKPFYEGLISYITSGPVVKMVVSGENAVATMRKLMGATNCADAAPGTIRGDFGLTVDENVIHGSDSVESSGALSRLPSASESRQALMARRLSCVSRGATVARRQEIPSIPSRGNAPLVDTLLLGCACRSSMIRARSNPRRDKDACVCSIELSTRASSLRLCRPSWKPMR